ncbi:MAG TPA: aminoglycoside adenylyltransferase domain-containing protein, partial [Lentzea sp.]
VLRSTMRADLPVLWEGIKSWAPMDVAWTQRYLVAQYCRTLYTLHTAEVTSKRGALEWGLKMLDQRWHPLIEQVIGDRDLGWDADAAPRPGSMEQTWAFAAYCELL